jgi:hypothetical protein
VIGRDGYGVCGGSTHIFLDGALDSIKVLGSTIDMCHHDPYIIRQHSVVFEDEGIWNYQKRKPR